MAPDPLAARLARFAVRARECPPPPQALAAAGLRLMDGLGVALAGLGAGSVVQPRSTAALFGDEGAASAIGRARPCPPAAATLHNGLLMHGLEFDDTHIGAVVHGAPVVLPVALACAEQFARPGAAMLGAICVGWEVLARIGTALRGELQRHGFQATSVAGPLAAAAVAAHLSGLDERQATHALGIAGSQSSGVFEFLQVGANSKALHGGWAALGGLVAASLAADGMTGPATILEGRAGLFAAFARAPELSARMHEDLRDLGGRWAVTETRPKLSPCCHYIQAFLEALDAVLQGGVDAARIRSLRCIVDPRQARLICEPWTEKLAPPTGYAAKWSLPYCLAARAVRGAVDVELFEGPLDDRVLAFAQRIDWSAHEDGFPDRYPGRIAVTLTDGQVVDSYVPDVLGGPGRAFPDSLLVAKFNAAATAVLPPAEAAALLEEILAIGQAPSPAKLAARLRGARVPRHLAAGRMQGAVSAPGRSQALTPERAARRVVQ